MADEAEAPAGPTTYHCGGCGASSITGFPPCVSGAAPHQAPAPGFPDPDWLRHAEAAHATHPVHGPFLAGLRQPPEVAPTPAPAPAMTPVPSETCPRCGAALLPPTEFPYCRACGATLGGTRRRR